MYHVQRAANSEEPYVNQLSTFRSILFAPMRRMLGVEWEYGLIF